MLTKEEELLKAKIKDLWVKALRSGKYEQTTYILNSGDNKFCCLGVLTDLYLKEKGLEWEFGLCSSELILNYKGESHSLHSDVMEWAGLNTSNGVFKKDEINTLANMNDQGAKFPEIADVIAENYELL